MEGAEARELPAWARGALVGLFLYLFVSAINILGSGLKTVGDNTDFIVRLLAHGDNPFVALMGSVFVTATVQSSSFTTSLIITLVAAGQLQLEAAVFAVMGANIGTSVTGIIVSLGNLRIRRQFRRAFTAALIHDIFNLMTVALLFPLEWATSAMHPSGHGVISRMAIGLGDWLGVDPLSAPTSPLKVITEPVVGLATWLGNLVTGNPIAAGSLVAILGLFLLFGTLVLLVQNLRGALRWRIEGLFRSVFFRNDGTAFGVGIVSTILVQSSTITTSLIVPLAGAGAVKLKRVLPFMLGANLGTTTTGVIAATANPVAAAVAVAITHVLFNLIGTLIWYPLRGAPLGLAQSYGRLAAQSTWYAILFLLMVFVIVPVAGIIATELLLGARGPG